MRDYNIEQNIKVMEAHLNELIANYSTASRDKYDSNDPKDHKEIERSITGFTKLIAAMDKFYSFKAKYEKLSKSLEKEEKVTHQKEETVKETEIREEQVKTAPNEKSQHTKINDLSNSDKILNIKFYEKVKKKHPKAIYDLKKRMIAVYKMQGIEKKRQDITYEECEAIADFYLKNIKTNEYNANLSFG